MAWITPITDRTQADVLYAKSVEYTATDLKGALNRSDLERIGENIYVILGMMGYDIDLESFSDILTPPEIPNVSYYNKLQYYLNVIVSSGYVFSTTPPIPARPYTVYHKWNDIEQILADAKFILDMALSATLFAGNGELYCNNFLI